MRNGHVTRRSLVLGLAAAGAAAFLPSTALAVGPAVTGRDFGLEPHADSTGPVDQSRQLQLAVDGAAAMGLPLVLAAGRYFVQEVRLPGGVTISGPRGRVEIVAASAGPALMAEGADGVTLENLTIVGHDLAAGSGSSLLSFLGCEDVRLAALAVRQGGGSGIALDSCSGSLDGLHVRELGGSAVFARNSRELSIRNCRVSRCGNGGILVWGDGESHDGTIIADNHISDIDWRRGGNGQNGNGINVFRANGVIVSGNVLRNCAFTAVRLNATRDTIVSGNTCLDCGEVAIFSEFGFSGSVIANNIVDGAAQGISITNFDNGGRLAICSGNLVRNILPRSAVNEDTVPIGIAAEADTVIANNVVESVPGLGIGAGWGPYLRDVVVTGNIVRDCEIGIGVSVAEGAGKAVVEGNRISDARRAGIAAMAWDEMRSDDLAVDAVRFPSVTLSGNSVN